MATLLVAHAALPDLPGIVVLHAFGGWLWLAGLGVATGCTAARCARPAAIAFGLAGLAAWSALPKPTATEPGPADLVVVSANLYTHNPANLHVLEALTREDPDVLVLQEVNPAWASLLDSLIGFPHRLQVVQDGAYGMAMLSRHPLLDPQILSLDGGTPAIEAVVQHPAGEVRVVGAHVVPPLAPWRTARWRTQLRELGSRVAGPTLLIGDFNATRYNPSFRELLAVGLRDALNTRTWPMNRGMPPMLALDHALVTDDLAVASAETLSAHGSDHAPLTIRLRLR